MAKVQLLENSAFIKLITPLAHSQKKPLAGLNVKTVKASFDIARAVGYNATKMWQQDFVSIGFDAVTMLILYHRINATTGKRIDRRYDEARYVNLSAFIMGALQALLLYNWTGEATNGIAVTITLGFLLTAVEVLFNSCEPAKDHDYKKVGLFALESASDNEVRVISQNEVTHRFCG